MSNELASVRFSDGSILYTVYAGTGSTVHCVLRANVEDVIADPFADPNWDGWLANASDNDSPNDFYKAQESIQYPDGEAVEIYTPYAGGILWSGGASKSAMRIVSGAFSEMADDKQKATPAWAKSIQFGALQS